MKKSLQISYLEKVMKRKGIPLEIYDLKSKVDSTLTYHENKNIIEKELYLLKKPFIYILLIYIITGDK